MYLSTPIHGQELVYVVSVKSWQLVTASCDEGDVLTLCEWCS
jgi:hypothetical protein